MNERQKQAQQVPGLKHFPIQEVNSQSRKDLIKYRGIHYKNKKN